MLPAAGLVGLLVGRTVGDRDRGRVTILSAVSLILVWTGSQYLTFLGQTDSAVGEIANLIQGHGWGLSALLASSWWVLTVWGVDRRRAGRPIGQFSRTGFHWLLLASSALILFVAVRGLLASVGGWDAWRQAVVMRGVLASAGQWGDWYQFVVFVLGPSLVMLMLGARPGFFTAKVNCAAPGRDCWLKSRAMMSLSRRCGGMSKNFRLVIHLTRKRVSGPLFQ